MTVHNNFLSVIIPCYNEADNIILLCEKIQQAFLDYSIKYEVVLIDDKSTDDTWQVMQAAKSRYGFVSHIRHETNRGIVGAWNTGVLHAKGDYIAIMDADLQYNPKDIPVLYELLGDKGVDVVQGVRCNTFQTSYLRKLLSKVFALMLNLLFLNSYKDIKSGFLVCRKDVFVNVLQSNHGYRCFQHFIGIALISMGYSLKQKTIDFALRNSGESFIASPLFFSLNALRDFPKAFFHFNYLRFFKIK